MEYDDLEPPEEDDPGPGRPRPRERDDPLRRERQPRDLRRPQGPDDHEHLRRAQPPEDEELRLRFGRQRAALALHGQRRLPYDANGNLRQTDEHVASGTSPPDTTLTTIRGYDGLDRLTSETQPLPDGSSRTVGYSYFKNGTRQTVTDPGDSVTAYTYDGQNRLKTATTEATGGDPRTTTYTYEPDDLLKTVSYPNGVVATHAYDKADRLLDPHEHEGRGGHLVLPVLGHPSHERPPGLVRRERQPPDPDRDERRPDRDDDVHLRRPRPPEVGQLPDRRQPTRTAGW